MENLEEIIYFVLGVISSVISGVFMVLAVVYQAPIMCIVFFFIFILCMFFSSVSWQEVKKK